MLSEREIEIEAGTHGTEATVGVEGAAPNVKRVGSENRARKLSYSEAYERLRDDLPRGSELEGPVHVSEVSAVILIEREGEGRDRDGKFGLISGQSLRPQLDILIAQSQLTSK